MPAVKPTLDRPGKAYELLSRASVRPAAQRRMHTIYAHRHEHYVTVFT